MYMIPFVLLYVVGYAFLKKRDAYGDFVRGAGEGIHTAFAILPTLVGLMTAVGILRASGFLKWLSDILGRLFAGIGFPVQLVPLAVVRLFSASAATGFLLDIFKEFGPDSKIGIIASLMLSCTETVWILNTTWKGKKYIFAMNGQTGKIVGDLPADNGAFWRFIAMWGAGIGLVLYALLWVFMVLL